MSVTSAGAQKLVIGSMLVAGTMSTIRDISRGHGPSIRMGIGLTFAGVTLSLIADSQPQLAASFAVLIIAASVFVTGSDALTAINAAVGVTNDNSPASPNGGGGSTSF